VAIFADANINSILVVIPGTSHADEYVVLSAHFDHLRFCDSVPNANTPVVCNGAYDNAGSVAAALGIGRKLMKQRPKRSILLAFWDVEEIGWEGSRYFADSPLVPLESIQVVLNMDSLGANLSPSLRDSTFVIWSETGGFWLKHIVKHAYKEDDRLEPIMLSEAMGQGSSDHKSFSDRSIPIVFFLSSSNGCYHSDGDEVQYMDLPKLEKEARVILTTAYRSANHWFRFKFHRARIPIRFSDVKAFNFLANMLSDNDLFLFREQRFVDDLQAISTIL